MRGGMLSSAVESVARTSVGQALLKLVDRFLWVVEKSAQWSLPCQDQEIAEENGKSFGKMELVRPLPWILFLPGLVLLRLIRAGLNGAAYALGYSEIEPSSMVKFVQKSRRRLRAIKTSGIKNLRQRKVCNAKGKRLSVNEAKKALIRSIRLTLSTLSCLDTTTSKSSSSPPPTKIYVRSTDLGPRQVRTPEEKSTTESAGSPMQMDAKRKFSELSSDESTSSNDSEEETLRHKIDRLALEDSTDDQDFNPADCTSTESTTSSDNDEDDENVSLSEVTDIREAAKEELEWKTTDEKNQLEEKTTDAEKDNDKAAEGGVAGLEEPPGTICSADNVSQDADAAFYSPISSKSASPERYASPIGDNGDHLDQVDDDFKMGHVENGESNIIAGSTSAASPTTPGENVRTLNGEIHEKCDAAQAGKSHQHQHHRGKRHGNHGNRKKK